MMTFSNEEDRLLASKPHRNGTIHLMIKTSMVKKIQENEGEDDGISEEDQKTFLNILNYDQEQWQQVLDSLSYKKNGTLSKGRIYRLHRAESTGYDVQEAFGHTAQEIIIRNIDDFRAEVQLEWRVEKW